MSTSLPFRKRLEQPALAPATAASPCYSPAHATLRRIAPLDRPVSVADTLRDLGLALCEAHTILNRLAADKDVVVTLPAVSDRAAAGQALWNLGVYMKTDIENPQED